MHFPLVIKCQSALCFIFKDKNAIDGQPRACLKDCDVPGSNHLSFTRMSSEEEASSPSSGKKARNIFWIQPILCNTVAQHSSLIAIDWTSWAGKCSHISRIIFVSSRGFGDGVGVLVMVWVINVSARKDV